MINFRYHVVSLVAVFLAVALGMIMGSTVISDTQLSALERDLRAFRSSNDQYRRDLGLLEQRIGFYERFGEAMLPLFVSGRLSGRHAVLIIQDGAAKKTIDSVEHALSLAGATKPSRLRLTPGWVLADDEARGRLAVSAGIAAGDEKSVLEGAGTALGTRLTAGADPKTEGDLLARMDRAGFLRIEDAAPGLFPQAGSVFVVIPSGARQAVPRQDHFYPALLRAIGAKLTAAVSEPFGVEESLAGRVLGDGGLATTISTVDHADTAPGMLCLVWALREMIDGRRAQHFGVRRGTSGVIPDLSELR